MSDAFWAQLAAPFILFVMLLIAWPIKKLVWRYMKDGKLKRMLFTRW